MLEARDVTFAAGGKTLLQETTVSFEPGRFHVIMGANGAGKSTLLKVLAGEEPLGSGTVSLDGRALHHYSKKDLALKRAVLSQHYNIAFPITAWEIVLMGRYPHFKVNPGKEDLTICDQAMKTMEVEHLKERDYQTLSGGEAQKVQMSRVLAQIHPTVENTKLLFLDEPVSHLDVKYQYQLLQVARTLSRKGVTVIAILHDINLAIAFADRLLFMKQGHILYDLDRIGSLTPAIINETFDVASRIIYPEGHQPVVLF
ncbi:MAG TPA: ATP-binding cassette domain-containing protein [Flavisolibacter sp.]|jgi:iron complex transport system ATP-binding protein|nr:ATP-binding cassette domain-containing protein [Flavisolibacter sp.]